MLGLLIRVCGIAALVGGALRIAITHTSWIAGSLYSGIWSYLTPLVFVMDAALLVGWIGLYLVQRARLGLFGTANYLIVGVGVLVLMAERFLPPEVYDIHTPIMIVALGAASLSTLRAGAVPRWIPIAWIASLAFDVIASAVTGQQSELAWLAAGDLLALGFMGVGVALAFGHLARAPESA